MSDHVGDPSPTGAPPANGAGAPPGPATAAPIGFTADWPTKAADAVDRVVDTIRDRAVRPVLIGARAVVFGVVIATVAIVVVVVLCVALVRFMTVYFWPGKVWASYYVLGTILVAGGFVLWSRRSSGADLDRP
ncbi:MAG TPA: hypothetical protein VKG43_11310 [Acidimicrobiales bacterium]|nr:hypothetical protein [Acidimicrobiales bacterium]